MSELKITSQQWRANMIWLNNLTKGQNMRKTEDDFEKLVADVQKRDECNRQDAFRRAREERPDEFEVWQNASVELAKAKPGAGRTAKAEEAPFDKCVSNIRKRDKCNQQDALYKARQEFPEEFEAWQNG
jgi:hypothetical protein